MYKKRPDAKIVALAVVLVAAVLVSVFFLLVRPAATGYVVYQEVKQSNQSLEDYSRGLDELKSMLRDSEGELSECTAANELFFRKLDEFTDKAAECENRRGAIEVNYTITKNLFAQKFRDQQDEIDRLEEEIKKLKDDQRQLSVAKRNDYDVLAENLANNICCKQKVDNPDISHYKVENHMVVCLESGQLAISCP